MRRISSEKATDRTTPTIDVENAYLMPFISTRMASIVAPELSRLKSDRPIMMPISVPRKPSDTSMPGTASPNAGKPGSYMAVSSLM